MIFKPKTKEELRNALEEYCENDDKTKGNINDWDVSLITDMSDLFFCCYNLNCNKKIHHFNQPINNWNVSNVTNMSSMFYNCKEFNQPINNWNVSNVTNISYMFISCKEFNQPINNWNVSNVTNMNYMFLGCDMFNQPIHNWNVSNVTKMCSIFLGCNKLNKTCKEQFYIKNIEKKNKYALYELLDDISIIKIYYVVKDKEFVMNNVTDDQKNKIQNFIKNKTDDICKSCYLQMDCVNNICGLCL